MARLNYIFPTKRAAAVYLLENPGRIKNVEYSLENPPSPLFPQSTRRFIDINEAELAVEEQEEVFQRAPPLNPTEVSRYNRAYINEGWILDGMSGVWSIEEETYPAAMLKLADKKAASAGPRLLSPGGRFGPESGGGGRLSAASGGGRYPTGNVGGGRLSAASGGGRYPTGNVGGGRLSAASGGGRALPSNINDILTGSDTRKLTLIEKEVYLLSSTSPRWMVDTDSIISKLSAIISKDGFQEWTRRNKRHAENRGDEISELLRIQRELTAQQDVLERTQLDPHTLGQSKLAIPLELKRISRELESNQARIDELRIETIKPNTFNEIDEELKLLASDMLIIKEVIEIEERDAGRKLPYDAKVLICQAHGVRITTLRERIQNIALMAASYNASEYLLKSRRDSRLRQIHKKIALLDLWRLSITYSGTNAENAAALSQLMMTKPVEDLKELAEMNEGYREAIFQGNLLGHGMGAPIELGRRVFTQAKAVVASISKAAELVLRKEEEQREGIHAAGVTIARPIVNEAIRVMGDKVSAWFDRATQGRFTRRLPNRGRRNVTPSLRANSGINSRKRGRALTPPESPESNGGRSNGGRANGGRANAGVIPLKQAMNRGSLEEVLAAGNAYNGNLPEVPAPYGRNAQGRAYAGVNKFGIPFLYSSFNAIPPANNRRNTKKTKPRSH